jgi:hypothetical protein
MACKQGDLLQIRGLGVQGEITHLHVFRPALSKGSHSELLCEVEFAAQQPSMFPQKKSHSPQPRHSQWFETSVYRLPR